VVKLLAADDHTPNLVHIGRLDLRALDARFEAAVAERRLEPGHVTTGLLGGQMPLAQRVSQETNQPVEGMVDRSAAGDQRETQHTRVQLARTRWRSRLRRSACSTAVGARTRHGRPPRRTAVRTPTVGHRRKVHLLGGRPRIC